MTRDEIIDADRVTIRRTWLEKMAMELRDPARDMFWRQVAATEIDLILQDTSHDTLDKGGA